MKSLLLPILSLAALCHTDPTSPSNLTFFTVWFTPHAPITLFQSTLITPLGSHAPHTSGDVQAIWPGLEPENGGAVLQDVVTNQGNAAGQWFFLPFYCCNPAAQLGNSTEVYPNDSITNIMALDTVNHHWANIWFDTPGEEGRAAGLGPFSGALSFDLGKYPKQDSYTTAVLAIEVQGKSIWDFGEVVWKNIIVEAQTTDTEWCSNPAMDKDLNATISEPMFTRNGGSTLCRIAEVVFHNPLKG